MVTLNINDIHAASSVSMKNEIWRFLQEQRNLGSFCDAVIRCGDTKFMAHRFILAAVSPYFRAQILGSFPNITEDGILLLALNDFSESSVQLFLDLVYEEINLRDVHIDVVDFLELLDFLQLDIYFDAVLTALRPLVTLENCLVLFNISRRYNAKKLTKMLATYIGAHIFDLIAGDHFQNIYYDDFESLLKWDMVNCLPQHLLQKVKNQLPSLKGPGQKHCIEKSVQQEPLKGEESYVTIMYAYGDSEKAQVVGIDALQNLDVAFPSILERPRIRDYFIFRGQLFCVLSKDRINPGIVIDRYDQTSKTYIEVFQEKITDLEKVMGIFSDLEANYVYLVYQTIPQQDYESDNWWEDLSDVCIIKVNIDEAVIVDRVVINSEKSYDIKISSVCYNARENWLYVINHFRYFIVKLNQKQVDSVRSSIVQIPFEGRVPQNCIVHYGSIYYFQVNESQSQRSILSISKSDPLKMSFVSVARKKIDFSAGSLRCTQLSSRHILLFVQDLDVYSKKQVFKIFKLDCHNDQLVEAGTSPEFMKNYGRDFICVPSHIFE